jgi:uncharacterized protein YbjQ (UPF0145 family)
MTQAADLGAAAIAEGALRRLSELKSGKSGSVFTSDLSVSEFLLVLGAGFRPLGLVLGSSVYHVGQQTRSWSVNQEIDVLSHALSHARELAMTRMQTQAKALGADGVVGLRLDTRANDFGSDNAEFVAIGTAVKAEPGAGGGQRNWRNNKSQPFTSNLSGQDFCALIRAGYAPLGMVVGSCVYHIARQGLGKVIGNLGRNAEIEQVTRAMYDARDLAMSRIHTAARALAAEGIVGMQLRQHSHTWDSHTTEFLAIGTAVRPLRDDHVIERPAMVLNLEH